MEGGGGGELVVVPVAPGRVRALPGATRARDDLDEMADELLGADDERPPGLADAVLVGGAAGLAGWGLFLDGEAWALPLGGAIFVLGGALPARWGWRALAARRLRRQQARALEQGLPMVVEGGEVRALVAAHERVLAASTSVEVRAGAHAALVEVAAALGGRPATDAASRRFVGERAEAVGALAEALDALPVLRRAQLLEARREVTAAGGFDALTTLDGLVQQVRSGDHRA